LSDVQKDFAFTNNGFASVQAELNMAKQNLVVLTTSRDELAYREEGLTKFKRLYEESDEELSEVKCELKRSQSVICGLQEEVEGLETTNRAQLYNAKIEINYLKIELARITEELERTREAHECVSDHDMSEDESSDDSMEVSDEEDVEEKDSEEDS
jgi:hypothetical protein